MSIKVEFVLFRSKLIAPHEASLFPAPSRPAMLIQAIKERKSIQLKRGHVWHIGNLTQYDGWPETKGYFAVGRTTRAINEKFDKSKHEFANEEFETSPYTHVFFDTELGLFIIASKHRLAAPTASIAKRLQEILQDSNVINLHRYQLIIDPINDPMEFLSFLSSAYQIKDYVVHYTKPNPFDAEEFFQKPFEKLIAATDGDKGTAKVEGENLDPEPLIELSKAAAATGNDASAKIVESMGKRPVRKHLRGNPSKFSVAEDHSTDPDVLIRGLEIYKTIRGSDE